jgi:choline dehydrogenase-like flavoprotein
MSTVVIGSGPAGVAAVHALLAAGQRVIVLDAGDRIEAGAMDVFDELGGLEPSRWPPQLARDARGAFPVGVKNVPLKPAYGSLFPYVVDDSDLPVTRVDAESFPSLAYGGLSNAWGASILPFRQIDIGAWPISAAELGPHYEAVLDFMPIAAERDELAELFPLYTHSPGTLRRAPQTQRLLRRMRRNAAALRAAGLLYGASRLAVRAGAGGGDCRYCGLCMYGCPYRSIYSSAQTLDELARLGQVDYRGRVYVDRLSESPESVAIDFHERGAPGARGRLRAARVLVACGAVSSTRLMVQSAGLPEVSLRLQDSQYFVVPMLTASAAPVSVATQGNTLAQLFVEMDDRRISTHAVHLQYYGYNDLILSILARRLPLSAATVERALQPLFGRLVVAQGYLHSADSPGLTLTTNSAGVRLHGDDGGLGAACIGRVVRRLAAVARLTGTLPVPGCIQIGPPGKGNHMGGSLPMRVAPRGLETDVLGRLPGWRRVHVVDASVLPSIPATTVTFSVMANAHRIAAAAAQIEASEPQGVADRRPHRV